ncbi:MAG: fumarylacetoacetase [Bacteroidia bacterium]|nr:fumarylacetoacetase [Bacteroidia bacterium]
MSEVFGRIDPSWSSWVTIPEDSDFSLQNLPYGVFKNSEGDYRTGLAIGSQIVDLYQLAQKGYLSSILDDSQLFANQYLNDLISKGKKVTNGIRVRVATLLKEGDSELKDNISDVESILIDQSDVTMQLPVHIGDYTDFYSSLDHAKNVGTMFRGAENAIMPNWKHLPVGYHGRASSIVASGTNIKRPKGQTIAQESNTPDFGPSKLMDFELEMGFVTGKSTQLGTSVVMDKAEDYIFGLVLFNDLSARDIQKWEYVPLGPFLGKNFGSVMSPWIVVLEALEDFRVDGYTQEPKVLPYLQYSGKKNYDIPLTVELETPSGNNKMLCKSNFKYMYWNMCQQLVHQTINGCNINVGDLYASGTISGPDPQEFGSMLELTWRGSKPIEMPDGSQRKFINDNDTIIMKGCAEKDGLRIGFGECRTKILPAD